MKLRWHRDDNGDLCAYHEASWRVLAWRWTHNPTRWEWAIHRMIKGDWQYRTQGTATKQRLAKSIAAAALAILLQEAKP